MYYCRGNIKTETARISKIEFFGVQSVKSNKPEGMILYSLSEMRHPEHRFFIFTNWDDENEACLEIIAESYNAK
jgi:quinol monooxygenase YgiN